MILSHIIGFMRLCSDLIVNVSIDDERQVNK
jgi:hypothetical protein